MLKDQSKSSSSKQRERMKTVREVLRAVSSVVIKTLKIALSNLFKKERSCLKPFLLQVEMNNQFNKPQFKTEADKILYTAIYLKDYTAKWFQSVLTDFLKQETEN